MSASERTQPHAPSCLHLRQAGALKRKLCLPAPLTAPGIGLQTSLPPGNAGSNCAVLPLLADKTGMSFSPGTQVTRKTPPSKAPGALILERRLRHSHRSTTPHILPIDQGGSRKAEHPQTDQALSFEKHQARSQIERTTLEALVQMP